MSRVGLWSKTTQNTSTTIRCLSGSSGSYIDIDSCDLSLGPVRGAPCRELLKKRELQILHFVQNEPLGQVATQNAQNGVLLETCPELKIERGINGEYALIGAA